MLLYEYMPNKSLDHYIFGLYICICMVLKNVPIEYYKWEIKLMSYDVQIREEAIYDHGKRTSKLSWELREDFSTFTKILNF